MKRLMPLLAAALLAASTGSVAFANGMGTPIEPAPAPTQLPPEGSAPAPVVSEAQQGQNWWLVALGIAVAIGIIVAVAEEDDDTTSE